MDSKEGYFAPSGLNLPAWLSPTERRDALEILDEIEQAFDAARSGGSSYTVEDGQAFVDRLNDTPERIRSYARLSTGLPVSSATARFDGFSPDGQFLISFELDFHEPNADEGRTASVNSATRSDNAGT